MGIENNVLKTLSSGGQSPNEPQFKRWSRDQLQCWSKKAI